MTDRETGLDVARLALLQSLIDFDPQVVEFHGDGSIMLHADPDILIPPIKLGHYVKLMPLDDRYFPENGKAPKAKTTKGKAPEDEPPLETTWDLFPRWLVEALEIFDIHRDLDSLPGWTLDPRLRTKILRHWQTVPFVRPAQSGIPTI